MPETIASAKGLKKLDVQDLSCARLFDEVPCYISIQDRDLRVVEANRKLIENFGNPIARKCYEVYKGRTETCPECPSVRTLADGKEHTSEETIFNRRGLPHNVIVNTMPLRDKSGAVVAVMEMFTDITVQKELEHRLHDSLGRFQNLFDTVPCYITVQDRDFLLVEANQRFRDAFGERLGRHCYEAYKGRSEPCEECPVALVYADGEVHHSEEVVTNLKGDKLHVLTYAAPVRNRRGEIVSALEVSTDITEAKELQDKLAFLGSLVAGTAHSVKNVLEGLRGGVYIVNMGFKSERQQDVKTGWEMVERNVKRVSDMIMDMLYCAKDRTPNLAPVDLCAMAQEVVGLYSQRAQDAGVALTTEIDPKLPPVAGESKDIHALFSNLVTNAIDACASCEDERDFRVSLRLYRDTGDAVIDVADNGVGMDTEARDRLFTMFFSTKGSSGTGLGLLVAHKVATEHGGSIDVTSEPGHGATFTVRLPLGR